METSGIDFVEVLLEMAVVVERLIPGGDSVPFRGSSEFAFPLGLLATHSPQLAPPLLRRVPSSSPFLVV